MSTATPPATAATLTPPSLPTTQTVTPPQAALRPHHQQRFRQQPQPLRIGHRPAVQTSSSNQSLTDRRTDLGHHVESADGGPASIWLAS